MSDIDYRHVADLLKVIEGCAGHTGKLGAIAAEAYAELVVINDELYKEQAEARRVAEEEAAKAAALAAEKVKAQEAADAKAAEGPKVIPAKDLDSTDSPPRRL